MRKLGIFLLTVVPVVGDTLSKSDIQALSAYIRPLSDPPSRSAGPVYARK